MQALEKVSEFEGDIFSINTHFDNQSGAASEEKREASKN